MTDSNVNVPDQPGYRGEPITSRLPTEHDTGKIVGNIVGNIVSIPGMVYSKQAAARMKTATNFVYYKNIQPGEEWLPHPHADRRPDGISDSTRDRVAALGITPQQVDTIRQKLEEIAKTVSNDFLIREIINSGLCGLVSFNWEVALKRLQEGKL